MSLADEFVLQQLGRLHSDRFGLADFVRIDRSIEGIPRRWMSAIVKQSDPKAPGRISGAGCHRQKPRSMLAALGEFIERYSASRRPRNELVITARSWLQMKEAGHSIPDLRFFNWFEDRQFEEPGFQLERFDRDQLIDWCAGVSLLNSEEVWLPSEWVRYGEKTQYWFGNSNGLAAHTDMKLATQNALLEVLERDVIMFSWWRNQKGIAVPLDWIEAPALRADLEMFADSHARVEFQILENPWGVFVVLATMTNAEKPSFLMGVGCAWGFDEACERALNELIQGLTYQRHQPGPALKLPPAKWFELKTFDEHVALHATPQPFLTNVFRTPQTRHPLVDLNPGSLVRTISRLEEGGLNPICFDRTSVDAKALGFSVVRVVVPGLLPLNSQHIYRPWGHVRLQAGVFNPVPHPMP